VLKIGLKNVQLLRLRVKQRGRPRKTWKEIVEKDMLDLELEAGYAMDHSR